MSMVKQQECLPTELILRGNDGRVDNMHGCDLYWLMSFALCLLGHVIELCFVVQVCCFLMIWFCWMEQKNRVGSRVSNFFTAMTSL
jgi:hypothetical protein